MKREVAEFYGMSLDHPLIVGIGGNASTSAAAAGEPALAATSTYVNGIPCMPVVGGTRQRHRIRIGPPPPLPALVAQKVTRWDSMLIPAARAAMKKEYDALRSVPAWDENGVREYDEVRGAARKRAVKAHFGRVFGLCVLKGSELPEGDPDRKYKGRFVFQGDNVRDEHGDWAIFQELGSSPAGIDASKAVDAYGLCPGHSIAQSDAEQAYVQAKLGGDVETWVGLPEEWRPAEWVGRFRRPVVPLLRALYGHPDSGGYWERHCDKAVGECGFERIPDWPSTYWNAKENDANGVR